MAAKGGDAAKADAAAAKPGEPPFGLKLDPDAKVLFKGKLGESVTVERTITNTTAEIDSATRSSVLPTTFSV
ncbi:hypothetical protein PMAYCL1PPCAC_02175 [Pristionchus mayeri]|uniref:Uncharacterized protein n=1 Tax=Pristionchus mayeri TaxID=1317129 RepID=A0AAN4Z299_9BILA|nr:hypothetical protein PMAYCL1PPCAC_02175 [Pristionchus mayeri]